MASHANLKRLQLLRDKLELRRDDIAVSEAALTDEARELAGRSEQLDLVKGRIADAVREMDELGRQGRTELAERNEFAHEDEALRNTFGSLLDQELKLLKEDRRKKLADAEAAGAAETELREVSVLFEDEEAVFRVTDNAYTFDELNADACRFFELHPLDVHICDEHDERWEGGASVRVQMSQYENAYGRIFLRFKPAEADEEGEAEDADNILQLLLKVQEEPEEEDDEAEMLAAQAAAMNNVGSQESAAQAKKKKKGKLNRALLLRELPVFLVFMFLFIFSLMSRRRVNAGFYQVPRDIYISLSPSPIPSLPRDLPTISPRSPPRPPHISPYLPI